MKIANYRMQHNEILPYFATCYLEERGEALERLLNKNYTNNDKYEYTINKSRQSESMYLDVLWDEGEINLTVSFRNHDNKAGSLYDIVIWLNEFKNWTDCKKFFINHALPYLLNNDTDNYNFWEEMKAYRNVNSVTEL